MRHPMARWAMDRRSGSLLAIPVVVSVVVVGGVLLWAPLFMASDQASILRTPNEDDETEKNRRETHTDKPEDSVCGLWLAPSTIPGAGLGMYAGMDFVPGQEFIRGGDSVVAISDIKQHNANVFYNHTRRDFLWDEYTWSGAFLRMDREGYHHVDAASAGFGASVNCHMPLNNVDESYPVLVNNGLHRAHHAGAGASTVFHRRLSTASQYVSAGSELFVSYGENYFTTRPSIGPVPFKHDLKRATLLVQKFSALQQKLVSRSRCHPPSPSKVAWDANIITADLWSTFVNNTAFRNSRTLLGGFKRDDPSDLVNIQSVYQDNVTLARMAESQRSLEWLRDFGTCADHIIGRKSTLPQAGMGAFATRNLSQGTIVAQLPMIHIPDRDRLSMRSLRLDDKGESWEPINETVVGYQLLLNYCYGHAASTMLLCPYGPMTNYINHNQSTANVMMRWGNATKGNHMPHLLNQTIEEIASSGATTKLAMELVALRDIGADEEIFLDYGDEWEAAWARHLSSWNPVPNANHYISAMQLETDKTRRLRSVFEEIRERTYSDDVITLCDTACQKNPLEMNMQHKNGTLALYLWETKAEWWPCSIFRYRDDQENHGEYLYTVHLFKEEKGVPQNNFVLRDLPREVFHFADKPGKSDAHLHNAFRHDVRISDSLFPEIWRNV